MYRSIFIITIGFMLAGTLGLATGVCEPSATQMQGYLDVATGHKYLQNADGTYLEFSRKGRLLKQKVPCDLPLFTKRDTIRPISPDSWILYEKNTGTHNERRILRASARHPEGFRCQSVLNHASINPGKQELGLGYSRIQRTVSYEGLKLSAIGEAYYDIATGHRYTRNPDHTYSQYSRKGRLLRTDVPSTLKLLTHGKYIFDVSDKDYIVYEKKLADNRLIRVQTATGEHPQGFSAQELYLSGR